MAHHRVGVVPQRVGEQEEPLAGRAQLVERGAELGVAEDVVANVLVDLGLEGAVAVDGVDALPDVVVELAVVDRQPGGLQQLDDLGVQAGLGQREEGIDPRVALAREPHLLLPVELQRSASVTGRRP